MGKKHPEPSGSQQSDTCPNFPGNPPQISPPDLGREEKTNTKDLYWVSLKWSYCSLPLHLILPTLWERRLPSPSCKGSIWAWKKSLNDLSRECSKEAELRFKPPPCVEVSALSQYVASENRSASLVCLCSGLWVTSSWHSAFRLQSRMRSPKLPYPK